MLFRRHLGYRRRGKLIMSSSGSIVSGPLESETHVHANALCRLEAMHAATARVTFATLELSRGSSVMSKRVFTDTQTYRQTFQMRTVNAPVRARERERSNRVCTGGAIQVGFVYLNVNS